MAKEKVRRYGPLTVIVRPKGRPSWEEGYNIQRFQVTLSIPRLTSHVMDVDVSYTDDEIPIADRMAAWNTISILRSAVKDPEFVEHETEGFRGRAAAVARRKAQKTDTAAWQFGEQALEDAFGDALFEGERLGKAIERGGPKEWLPGADLSGTRGAKEWSPRGMPWGVLRRGQRVILRDDVDRYPDFLVKRGAKGEVAWFSYGPDGKPDFIAVRMDERIPGAEEWDNEVHWYGDFVDDYWQDVRPGR